MSGFRVQIKAGSIKLKTDRAGKTTVVPVQSYASVSDKLKRKESKKMRVKRK